MNAADRTELRLQIDSARRAQLAARGPTERVCRGCGAEWSSRTTGCNTCNDRHGNWLLRGDPRHLPSTGIGSAHRTPYEPMWLALPRRR